MATIAIGDIHGNLRALDDLLARIEREVNKSDTVVFLGDYVDRGPDTRGCIERILDFERSARASVITLLGNHEEWLLRTFDDYSRHSWIFMGAFPTIESYSRTAVTKIHCEIKKLGPKLILDHVRLPYDLFFDAKPRKHIDFIKSLKIYHRSPDGVCVHGGLDPAAGPPEEQKTEDLIWGTDEFPEAYSGEDTIFYGHVNNPEFDANRWPRPRIVGKTYGLDTISEGVLSAVRLPGGDAFQSGRHIYETGV